MKTEMCAFCFMMKNDNNFKTMTTEDKRFKSSPQDERYSQKGKNENKNDRKANVSGSHKPRDEKDSQSKLSKDPTRKNEAQQGESDLRKRTD